MSRKRPKNGQKWPKMCAVCVKQPHNRKWAVSWATWLKTEFRGHLVHPQPPQNRPTRRLDPRTSGQLVGREGNPGRAGWGPTVGRSTRVPGAKIILFSKSDPGPLGMLKQVFFPRFVPVMTRFGSRKIPKCFENGLFWDQKWVKNGSKTCCSKNDHGPFGDAQTIVFSPF